MESGLLSTLPVIAGTFTHTVSGYFSDYLQHGMKWSRSETRRFITMNGFFATAALLVMVGYTREQKVVKAVVLTTLCAGVLKFNHPMLLSNVIDLFPTFTGVIFGLINMFGVSAGIGAPEMTGFITNHNPSSATYKLVFFVNSGICVLGGLAGAFLSGDTQVWDSAPKHMK